MAGAKQQRIPGMVPPEIQEIEDKAEEVKELQADRMDVAQRETKARDELTTLMKKHKRKTYSLDEKYEVVVESSEEKAFVRKKKGVKKEKTAAKAKDGGEDAPDLKAVV